ncbi:MAG: VOC family protein [Pseudomonadota bacterium]|jgi:catechol 2,3-dioxygenase-like lactoylglutathione lyase family enzyme|nr:VOC family protein [Pseudomonadota bacterium]
MAKIKHIAIVTMDPEKLASFYQEVFEMEVLHTSKSGGFYLTDGYINVALLPNKAEGKPNGLNHFGFEIENQEEIGQRMEKFGLQTPAQRPRNRPYAETRGCDPDGNNFDLSVHGFQDIQYEKEREQISENKKELAEV